MTTPPASKFEEKAREIVRQILDHDIEEGKSGSMIMTMQIVERISSALQEAVLEEREACAKIVDNTAQIFEGDVYVDPDVQYNTPEHRQKFACDMISIAATTIRTRSE